MTADPQPTQPQGEVIQLFPTATTPAAGTAAEIEPTEPPTGPVLDAELVTEEEWQRTLRQRMIDAAVSKLPTVWHTPDSRREASKALAGQAILTPFRYPGAVARGTLVAGRTWWQWLTVADFYTAAKAGDQLAMRYTEIHSHRVRRRWWTLGVATTATTTLIIIELAEGPLTWWLAGATASAVLAIAGRRKDAGTGRKAVVGPRSLAWAMDGDHLVVAFRDAKLIGKDEGLQFVRLPKRDGSGWYVIVDLPPSRRASKVLAAREDLASALAVDEMRLILERVRGDDGHAGRLALWVGDSDPYAVKPLNWPLADAETWDFWRATPFGTVARGQQVNLPMVWTSLLTGAIPRMGKTYAARIPATSAALDPHVLLIGFDGKGGKDWRPFEQVAHRFGRGDDDETCARLLATLRWAATDVARRFDVIGELNDEICPESKVTPDITRNPTLNMPLVLINIDEVQVYLEDDTPVEVGIDAKGNPKYKLRGRIVCDLLTYIAKKGPAAGYMLNLATQKPDAQVIPDKLRGQVGTRFALKTMTWQASETILGAGTYKAGMDASKLLKGHKGVGLLLGADGETELEASEAITVRTYKLEIGTIRAACKRGRAARIAAGTLTGDAAGHRLIDDIDPDLASRVDAEVDWQDTVDTAAAADSTAVTEDLPEVLGLLADVIEDHETGLIPTAALAARLGGDWDAKSLGEALRRAAVPPATPPKKRMPGYSNPVSLTDLDAIRATVINHVEEK